jgi:hypothetical protein
MKDSAMKAQYFVLYDDGQWKIKAGYRLTGHYDSKTDAMRAAIDYAEKDGQTGRDAEVLIQDQDRIFHVEWVYGRDPYPSKAARPRSPAVSSPAA